SRLGRRRDPAGAPHSGPGRAGERRRPIARRGAARHPPAAGRRGRVRRLGGVVQRNGRCARDEDHRAVRGAGAGTPLHGRRRPRAAHAADGARERGGPPARPRRRDAGRCRPPLRARRDRRRPPAPHGRGSDGDLPAGCRHGACPHGARLRGGGGAGDDRRPRMDGRRDRRRRRPHRDGRPPPGAGAGQPDRKRDRARRRHVQRAHRRGRPPHRGRRHRPRGSRGASRAHLRPVRQGRPGPDRRGKRARPRHRRRQRPPARRHGRGREPRRTRRHVHPAPAGPPTRLRGGSPMRRLASLFVIAMATAACSGNGAVAVSSVPHGTTSPATTSTTINPTGGFQPAAQVWFVRDGKLFQVTRPVTPGGDVQVAALHALLAGPTPAERADGVTSAVPPHTQLLGLGHRAGVATVDMSAELGQGTNAAAARLLLAQLVYTVAQAAPIHAMRLRLDDAPVSALPGSGVVVPRTLTRTRYESLVPPVQIAVIDESGNVLGQRHVRVGDGRFDADVTVKLASHAGRGEVVATDSAGGSARIPVRVGVRPLDVYWTVEGAPRVFNPLHLWVWDNRPVPGPVEVIVRGGNGATAGHALVLPYPCDAAPCRLPLHVVNVPFSLSGVQYGSIEVDTIGPPYYTLRIPRVRLAPGDLPPVCTSSAFTNSATSPLSRAAAAVSAGAGRYLPTAQLITALRLRAPQLGRLAVAPEQRIFAGGGLSSSPPANVTWLGETPGGRALTAGYSCGDQGSGQITTHYGGRP